MENVLNKRIKVIKSDKQQSPDMNLYFQKMGEHGIPLIILHGLYGSSDNWMSIARKLSANYKVFVPDMRNHGRSPFHAVHTYPVMAMDVLHFMDVHDIPQCILLGHSMGGKVAMHVTANAPQRVLKLIIDDIAPVNYASLTDYSPLAIEHLGVMDTMLRTDLTRYSKREEIDRAWESSIPDASVRQFLLKNIQRGENHQFSWRLNIKALVKNLPHILNGMDELELNKGHRIENIPTLFLKGELSPYITSEMYPFIRQAFPWAQIVTIPHAGHWMHVEEPELFLDAVTRFLKERKINPHDNDTMMHEFVKCGS